ncbi:hypothetical protein K8I28_00190 [bacterium]|nr:hypothetical protein [bacterium]
MDKKQTENNQSSDLLVQAKEIEKALLKARKRIYDYHKRLGHPIYISRNDEVVRIEPEDIPD